METRYDGVFWICLVLATASCSGGTSNASMDAGATDGGYAHADGASNAPADAGATDGPGACVPPACGVNADTIVLFGGQDALGVTNDETWTFDGATWVEVATAKTPPARSGAAMAALGNRLVLFGGSSTMLGALEPLGDTWIFDGETWTQVPTTSDHPPARALATMGELDGKVVLFGGLSSNAATPFNDTWTFDGASWSLVPTPTSPPPYEASGASNMATLENGQLALVSSDTWVFDSKVWSKLPVEPTPANSTNGASLAPLNGELVLYSAGWEPDAIAVWKLHAPIWEKLPIEGPASGYPNPGYLAPMVSTGTGILMVAPVLYSNGGEPMDVWSFDGAHWTNLHIPNGPPLRVYPAWAQVR